MTSSYLQRWQKPLALLIMTLSGFAGLGYQILWTQQSSLWLGHESAAVLAVITAFFGGLSLGSLLFGSLIEKSSRPIDWYVGSEWIIASWSLILALTLQPLSSSLLNWIGSEPTPLWQWSVTFIGTFFLLLPATITMGITLPAMERVTAAASTEGRSVALLYAFNTLGAVLGVITIAFWWIPHEGLLKTTLLCVAINIICGTLSLSLLKPGPIIESKAQAPIELINKNINNKNWIALTLTGLLGIGYEIVVIRVLSQVTEDTVYTFALLLAVYLIGSSIGAAAYDKWLGKRSTIRHLEQLLLISLSVSCLIGSASLWGAESIKSWVLNGFGHGMQAALAAESLLALCAFALPTLVMGALFSHLSNRAHHSGISYGQAIGYNLLGATLAPVIFGVIAIPTLGLKYALLSIAMGYLALAARSLKTIAAIGLLTTTVTLAAHWVPTLAFIDVPEGGRIIRYEEGISAAVSVVEDADGVARLRINNRQQEGSSATLRVDARQALLPILLHPEPKQVLFLGLGTGITASSAAAFPGLKVDAAELLPEVINASSFFTQNFNSNESASHLNIINSDARRFVRTHPQHYDVIVADNFHPARSGSGSLYTVEHFAAIRDRLMPQGIFCQWLPLHQLDLETLRSIIKSFISVYPSGWAMLASNSLETPVIGLVATQDSKYFNLDTIKSHIASNTLPEKLAHTGIEDEYALLGSFIAGPVALSRFSEKALLNTDNHTVVTYSAPKITYEPDSLPRDRLLQVIDSLSVSSDELMHFSTSESSIKRLQAYWMARNKFIKSGRDVKPTSNVLNMLIQVKEPLLSVLRISPDFRPAYDPLITMADSVAKIDPNAARSLLNQLMILQPERPEAALLLQQYQ